MNRKTAIILSKAESILKQKRYSKNTTISYSDWIYRFLFYYEKENIQHFGKKEISQFLSFLDKECFMAPSSINLALNAILFLYKEVYDIAFDNVSFKTKLSHVKPAILHRTEISEILSTLKNEKWLMTSLMYGCGLTGSECVHLRIKNIDYNNIVIHIENGNYSRKTLFPKSLHLPVKNQIDKVKTIYNENMLLKNYAGVPVSKKITTGAVTTSKVFENHFLFPSRNLHFNEESGLTTQNCVSESYLQKIYKNFSEKKAIQNHICCSSFRHSFATHLIEAGYDIHFIKELMGHKNLQSTMIYKNLAKFDVAKITSPLDKLMIN